VLDPDRDLLLRFDRGYVLTMTFRRASAAAEKSSSSVSPRLEESVGRMFKIAYDIASPHPPHFTIHYPPTTNHPLMLPIGTSFTTRLLKPASSVASTTSSMFL